MGGMIFEFHRNDPISGSSTTTTTTTATLEEFSKRMMETNQVILPTDAINTLPIYTRADGALVDEEEYTRQFVAKLLQEYDASNNLSKFNYNMGTQHHSLNGLVDLLSQERIRLSSLTAQDLLDKHEILINWKTRFMGIMSNINENSSQYCIESAKLSLLYQHINGFFSKEAATLFNNCVITKFPKKTFVVGERVIRVYEYAPELVNYLPPMAYLNDDIFLMIFERVSGTKQKRKDEGGFVYTFQEVDFNKKKRRR